MNITIEATGPYSYALNIEASAEDLEDAIEQALRERRKTAQINGFGPGLAPMQLVRKLYEEEIGHEVAGNLVVDIFEDLVEESPEYDLWADSEDFDDDYAFGAGFKARVPFAVWPKVAIKDFEGERIEVPALQTTPAMVDEALEELLWNYGTCRVLEPGATVQDGDLITYEARRTDQAAAKQAAVWESGEQVLALGSEEDAVDEALRESVIGAAVGDVVRFSVWGSTREDGLRPEVPMHFEAVISSAERVTPAELTAALARRVLQTEDSTVDDLRDWVSLTVDIRTSTAQASDVEECMRERLLDLHEIVAPELVVRQRVRELLQLEGKHLTEGYDLEELDPALVRHMLSSAETWVKWIILKETLLDRYEEEFEPVDYQGNLELGIAALVMQKAFENTEFDVEGLTAELVDDLEEVQEQSEDLRLFRLLANKFDVVLVTEDGRHMPYGADPAGEAP